MALVIIKGREISDLDLVATAQTTATRKMCDLDFREGKEE